MKQSTTGAAQSMAVVVVVSHVYSPIRVRAYDVEVKETTHEHRAVMTVTIPQVDGQLGIFGFAKITWDGGDGGDISLRVARGCWSTVAADGCDIEWTTGPQNWQGRIERGQINGFAVGERGHMSGVK